MVAVLARFPAHAALQRKAPKWPNGETVGHLWSQSACLEDVLTDQTAICNAVHSPLFLKVTRVKAKSLHHWGLSGLKQLKAGTTALTPDMLFHTV